MSIKFYLFFILVQKLWLFLLYCSTVAFIVNTFCIFLLFIFVIFMQVDFVTVSSAAIFLLGSRLHRRLLDCHIWCILGDPSWLYLLRNVDIAVVGFQRIPLTSLSTYRLYHVINTEKGTVDWMGWGRQRHKRMQSQDYFSTVHNSSQEWKNPFQLNSEG